jgi:type IV pilus assembly protein PilN
MRVPLNLATKPLESHRRFLVGSGITIFAASIILLGLGWHVYSVRKAAASVRMRTDQLYQEYAKYEAERNELKGFFEQKDIKGLNERAAFINGIIVVRSFNWTQMFMDLERILPGGVHVISIEPKQVSGHVEVKLTAGVISDEIMLKFVQALETSSKFSDVQLQGIHPPANSKESSGDQRIVQLTAFYTGT